MATVDVATAKQQLMDLMKRDDLKNKACFECGAPSPLWASISFAIFICLSCAGVHRGFGVHISFVRSCTMDTWTEDQLKRMRLGGNEACRVFLASYTPAEASGYSPDMDPYDKFRSWAASQYRDKLTADLEGKPWSPSLPPPKSENSLDDDRPSSGLRKSRAGTSTSSSRTPSANRQNSSYGNLPTYNGGVEADQKSSKEAYFASLGQSNAARPDHLPPSQGGRYGGFGNSPSQTPPLPSSALAPSLTEFQTAPLAAISRSFSLFSSVARMGVEKVMDPGFREGVAGYVSEAGKKATEVGKSANEWGKAQLGVDVAGQVGGLVGSISGSGPGGRGNYTAVGDPHGHGMDDEEEGTSALYQAGGHDDFFTEWDGQARGNQNKTSATAPKQGGNKKEDWGKEDDEWKDF